MNWDEHRHDWPHAGLSQFVTIGSVRWHYQRAGTGKKVLLLHGSGATTHSFEGVFSLLQDGYDVLVLDLPGHGFTKAPELRSPTIENVCATIEAFLDEVGFYPDLVIAHSAGAAISVQLIVSGVIAPDHLVAINGAFFPFPGMAGHLFPAAAKLLFLNPFVPSIFSAIASFGQVERVINSTGSKLSQRQLDYYGRAFCDPKHVQGTLAMMANWDLEPMPAKLKKVKTPTLLVIGQRDGTIDPATSDDALELFPNAERCAFENAGHLVHEEQPDEVTAAIAAFAKNSVKRNRHST